MILWSGNYQFDDGTIEMMSLRLQASSGAYEPNDDHYSSYHLDIKDRPDYMMKDFYTEITNHVLTKLSLYDRIRYHQSYWMQLYKPGSKGHGVHDHWSGNEVYSWVHFLKPVKKCFYFIIDGQKVYPEQQNPGDFIAFPSWLLHKVDVNDTNEDRIVVAGNVMFNSLEVYYERNVTKRTICHRINDNLCLWETNES